MENRNRANEKTMRVFEKKWGEKRRKTESPVRGPSRERRILNKYIIMPAVPSACFQPLPSLSPVSGVFFFFSFPFARKNRP